MSELLFGTTLLTAFLGGMVALLAPCCVSVVLPAYLASGFRSRGRVLTQPDCHYCDHAKAVLDRVGRDHPITVIEIDLRSDTGQRLAADAGVLFAPGVLLDGGPFAYGRLSERKLRRALIR